MRFCTACLPWIVASSKEEQALIAAEKSSAWRAYAGVWPAKYSSNASAAWPQLVDFHCEFVEVLLQIVKAVLLCHAVSSPWGCNGLDRSISPWGWVHLTGLDRPGVSEALELLRWEVLGLEGVEVGLSLFVCGRVVLGDLYESGGR
jgi:hypothetical protein